MATTASKRKSKIKTYDLILNESMKLFNEHGVESVSINRVADCMGISTGNLTYHFKRRTDLIATHMQKLDTVLVEYFENFPHERGHDEYIIEFTEIFTIVWQHRFLFNSAPYLIQNELVKPRHYQQLIDNISAAMIENLLRFQKQGLMKKPMKPYDNEMLVNCIWLNWLGWLRVNQLIPRSKRHSFSEVLYNGINHSLFLTRPYMDPGLFGQVHKALARKMKRHHD